MATETKRIFVSFCNKTKVIMKIMLFILTLFILTTGNLFAQTELHFKNDTISIVKVNNRIRIDNATYDGEKLYLNIENINIITTNNNKIYKYITIVDCYKPEQAIVILDTNTKILTLEYTKTNEIYYFCNLTKLKEK